MKIKKTKGKNIISELAAADLERIARPGAQKTIQSKHYFNADNALKSNLCKMATFAALKNLNEGMGIQKQQSWKQAWQSKRFRSLFLFGAVGLSVTVIIWPVFLGHIEKRTGLLLHDSILAYLPIIDLSVPIFACLWGAALLMLIRIVQKPTLFLMFMFSYWMLFFTRMLTIQFMPLDAPIGLLRLRDPISNLFYGHGGTFITKDLFFSGHTATMFLIFFFLEKKREKWFALLAGIAVGVMVMFQHIHYAVDVLFAPLFAFGIYWLVRKWFKNLCHETDFMQQIKRKSLVN